MSSKTTIPDAVREYLSQLGKKKKRITPADSRARSARLAKARAAITPEAIARRTKTRLAKARAAITPEAIARRTKTRLAKLALKNARPD